MHSFPPILPAVVMAGEFSRIGPALVRLRKARGVSAEQQMAKMRIAKTTFYKVERDGSNPQAATIERYLSALGATAYDLARAIDQEHGRTIDAEPSVLAESLGALSTSDLANARAIIDAAPLEERERAARIALRHLEISEKLRAIKDLRED